MTEFLVYHRFDAVVVPEGTPPMPTGMQGLIVEADDAQTAVDTVLDTGAPFHNADTVFAIDLSTAQTYTVTHSHEASPA